MHCNLRRLNSLLENNPILKKLFVFDLTDALLVAELYFAEYFFIYYSKNSSNFLLLHYVFIDYSQTASYSYEVLEQCKSNYTHHDAFEEVLEEINIALTNNYKEQFVMHWRCQN